MKRIVLGVLVAAALVFGCKPVQKQLDKVDASIPPVVTNPPEVKLPALPLPKTADGLYELIEVAGSTIGIDPTQNDPISAVGRCSDLINGCYEGGQSLDACIAGVRRCTTNEPWRESDDCCPSACADAYAQERTTNADPLATYEKVFFVEPGCFPGVLAALGGGQ